MTSSSLYRPSLQLVSHVVRNRPCWKARIALGKDKQKNTKRSRTSFKVVLKFLCLPCPVLFLCPMAFLGILLNSQKGSIRLFYVMHDYETGIVCAEFFILPQIQ